MFRSFVLMLAASALAVSAVMTAAAPGWCVTTNPGDFSTSDLAGQWFLARNTGNAGDTNQVIYGTVTLDENGVDATDSLKLSSSSGSLSAPDTLSALDASGSLAGPAPGSGYSAQAEDISSGLGLLNYDKNVVMISDTNSLGEPTEWMFLRRGKDGSDPAFGLGNGTWKVFGAAHDQAWAGTLDAGTGNVDFHGGGTGAAGLVVDPATGEIEGEFPDPDGTGPDTVQDGQMVAGNDLALVIVRDDDGGADSTKKFVSLILVRQAAGFDTADLGGAWRVFETAFDDQGEIMVMDHHNVGIDPAGNATSPQAAKDGLVMFLSPDGELSATGTAQPVVSQMAPFGNVLTAFATGSSHREIWVKFSDNPADADTPDTGVSGGSTGSGGGGCTFAGFPGLVLVLLVPAGGVLVSRFGRG
jgi:hypothetical protein